MGLVLLSSDMYGFGRFSFFRATDISLPEKDRFLEIRTKEDFFWFLWINNVYRISV